MFICNVCLSVCASLNDASHVMREAKQTLTKGNKQQGIKKLSQHGALLFLPGTASLSRAARTKLAFHIIMAFWVNRNTHTR